MDTGFMQEKIKARPVNHRKILRRTLGTAGLAVLFGGVACLVFLVMEPVISRLLYPDENKVQEVTFSEDGQTMDSAAGSSLETEGRRDLLRKGSRGGGRCIRRESRSGDRTGHRQPCVYSRGLSEDLRYAERYSRKGFKIRGGCDQNHGGLDMVRGRI